MLTDSMVFFAPFPKSVSEYPVSRDTSVSTVAFKKWFRTRVSLKETQVIAVHLVQEVHSPLDN